MTDKKNTPMLTPAKKVVTGGTIGLAALLGLLWTIFINPIRGEVKEIDKSTHINKEKNIEQDGKIEANKVLLKRIDGNIKILLDRAK